MPFKTTTMKKNKLLEAYLLAKTTRRNIYQLAELYEELVANIG